MMKIQQYLKSHTFLRDGAVFIADSHYSKQNEDLYDLLLEINNGHLVAPQLFLVGDIFQLLLPFEYLVKYNKKVIDLINEISNKIDVYYFEGNHDFCLDGIFCENVKILKKYEKDEICINHGDIYTDDCVYKFYVKIIRKKWFMKFIDIVSFNFLNNWLFKKILNKKISCENMKNFELLAQKKIQTYKKCQLIIEGHYHQNKTYDKYVNLPSLYCQKSYLKLKNKKFIEKNVKN